MTGILLSGPAGGGKSQAARRLYASLAVPGVVIDFQSIYAALGQIDRLPNGRYPERLDSEAHLLSITEYLRRAAITAAVRAEIYVIATNSDGAPARRAKLLEEIGPGSTERVIDPGESVVTQRLSDARGVISTQCLAAKNRWYSRV